MRLKKLKNQVFRSWVHNHRKGNKIRRRALARLNNEANSYSLSESLTPHSSSTES